MLNLIYENDLEEIFKFNENCLENILLIIMTFIQILNYFRSTNRCNYNDNNLRDLTIKKIEYIHNLYKEYYAKLPTEERSENLNSVEEVLNFYKNHLK